MRQAQNWKNVNLNIKSDMAYSTKNKAKKTIARQK